MTIASSPSSARIPITKICYAEDTPLPIRERFTQLANRLIASPTEKLPLNFKNIDAINTAIAQNKTNGPVFLLDHFNGRAVDALEQLASNCQGIAIVCFDNNNQDAKSWEWRHLFSIKGTWYTLLFPTVDGGLVEKQYFRLRNIFTDVVWKPFISTEPPRVALDPSKHEPLQTSVTTISGTPLATRSKRKFSICYLIALVALVALVVVATHFYFKKPSIPF